MNIIKLDLTTGGVIRVIIGLLLFVVAVVLFVHWLLCYAQHANTEAEIREAHGHPEFQLSILLAAGAIILIAATAFSV